MTRFGLRKKILWSFLFVFIVWGAGLAWFTQRIPREKTELPASDKAIIAVLTGGAGRVEYGLQLLAEHKGKLLFISGVGDKVGIGDILQQLPKETRAKINEKNIILGRDAENTVGNAEEISDLLQNNSAPQIILVTSSYHMPRSVLEVKSLLKNVAVTPAPVIASQENIDRELLLSEYHKYLLSKLRHAFISGTSEE